MRNVQGLCFYWESSYSIAPYVTATCGFEIPKNILIILLGVCSYVDIDDRKCKTEHPNNQTTVPSSGFLMHTCGNKQIPLQYPWTDCKWEHSSDGLKQPSPPFRTSTRTLERLPYYSMRLTGMAFEYLTPGDLYRVDHVMFVHHNVLKHNGYNPDLK